MTINAIGKPVRRRVIAKVKYGPFVVGVLLLLFLGCVPTPETNAEPQKGEQVAATGDCPQVRKTPSAPKKMHNRANPVVASNTTLQRGQRLYQKANPLACKLCHGEKGNGKGDPDFESMPPARNFSCSPTMKTLSDGQLFWIIRNGSPNTSMPAFADLSEEDIWSLVHYLRNFSKSK